MAQHFLGPGTTSNMNLPVDSTGNFHCRESSFTGPAPIFCVPGPVLATEKVKVLNLPFRGIPSHQGAQPGPTVARPAELGPHGRQCPHRLRRLALLSAQRRWSLSAGRLEQAQQTPAPKQLESPPQATQGSSPGSSPCPRTPLFSASATQVPGELPEQIWGSHRPHHQPSRQALLWR